jgi:hypothetical protein
VKAKRTDNSPSSPDLLLSLIRVVNVYRYGTQVPLKYYRLKKKLLIYFLMLLQGWPRKPGGGRARNRRDDSNRIHSRHRLSAGWHGQVRASSLGSVLRMRFNLTFLRIWIKI